MIGPSTSACPVAVTVLGKPKPRKSPCARTDPDENNIKTETKTESRNFILVASYSQMHRRWPSSKTMDLGQVRGARWNLYHIWKFEVRPKFLGHQPRIFSRSAGVYSEPAPEQE